MGKLNSTRVDEGKKCRVLAMKMEARTVVGREGKSLLCDPGSELQLLGGSEKRRAKITQEISKNQHKTKGNSTSALLSSCMI